MDDGFIVFTLGVHTLAWAGLPQARLKTRGSGFIYMVSTAPDCPKHFSGLVESNWRRVPMMPELGRLGMIRHRISTHQAPALAVDRIAGSTVSVYVTGMRGCDVSRVEEALLCQFEFFEAGMM